MEESTRAPLHPDTKLGYVQLKVSDMERSLDYYQESIGLTLHGRKNGTAHLGAGERDLLVLSEVPGAQHLRGRTGLYHFALLTPSRQALAHALQRLIDTRTPISGGSDHGVSEALYLDDPDGNGIEIYRDRPKAEWPYANGKLRMVTDPIDIDGILGELDGATAPKMERETVLGHMHLHVAYLPESVDFYTRVIGLELQQYYGDSAAFLSAGGYHHHLGLNTWAGKGAPAPPDEAAGMRNFGVQLVGEEEMERLVQRLDAASVAYERRENELVVRDPSQNEVVFAVRR